jgi:hypothetical protein
MVVITIASMLSSTLLKIASMYAHKNPRRGTAPGLAMRV